VRNTDDDQAAGAKLDAAAYGTAPAKNRRRLRKRPRPKTIALKRITREDLRLGALMFPPVDEPRPTTRSDCENGINDQRPCPWVGCKYHLYLEVNERTGSIKLVFPELEPWELKETCALDVAARGGITLEEVGELSNRTRERVRQEETQALCRLLGSGDFTRGDIE
jgi:hypothetical protein